MKIAVLASMACIGLCATSAPALAEARTISGRIYSTEVAPPAYWRQGHDRSHRAHRGHSSAQSVFGTASTREIRRHHRHWGHFGGYNWSRTRNPQQYGHIIERGGEECSPNLQQLGGGLRRPCYVLNPPPRFYVRDGYYP